MRFLILLLLAVIANTCWAGDIYRWVDEKGVIRYSDMMPQSNARNIQKFKSTGSSLIAEKPVAIDKLSTAPSPELSAAAEKLPVTLYSFKDCGEPCNNAEDLLNKRGVPFQIKNTNQDMIALQKLTGKLDVPVLVIGSTTPITGFEEGQWNKELDLAGYAKSNQNPKPGTSLAITPPAKDAKALPAEKKE